MLSIAECHPCASAWRQNQGQLPTDMLAIHFSASLTTLKLLQVSNAALQTPRLLPLLQTLTWTLRNGTRTGHRTPWQPIWALTTSVQCCATLNVRRRLRRLAMSSVQSMCSSTIVLLMGLPADILLRVQRFPCCP